MKGSELLKKIKALGNKNGIRVELMKRRGKGSHGTLFYGNKYAIIPNIKAELKSGTYNAILKQLAITKDDMR